MSILLSGGAGYIGSHVALTLINASYDIVIADNFSNCADSVPERIADITGIYPKTYREDITDSEKMERIFQENHITAVIHLAGFKAVAESVEHPLKYYRNNLDGLLTLLEVMRRHNCGQFVFSSSATVYAPENPSPLKETAPSGNCGNPYGWTKHMAERILMDAAKADDTLSVVLLRYFNPVGAHPSGLLGEEPSGTPNNLMPRIVQAASGAGEALAIFGDDYPTPDGTCVRDYIHVMDLAEGHLAAIQYAQNHSGVEIFNLGTGRGVSVRELVETFQRINGMSVPFQIAPRRPGDTPICFANVDKAEKLLGWSAKRTLDDMCRDAWHWELCRRGGQDVKVRSP